MPRHILELMRDLHCRIGVHEALATQDARKAEALERSGRYGEAEALRTFARNHRIRALEAHAHIRLAEMGFGWN